MWDWLRSLNAWIDGTNLSKPQSVERRHARGRSAGWTGVTVLYLAPGTKIRAFTLTECLGKGGMSSVWKASHAETGTDYALKILHGSMVDEDMVRQRFFEEGLIQSRVSHPNVVAVKGRIEAHPVHALVMEYVDGPTLERYVSDRPNGLTLPETKTIATGVLSALNAAHRRGIIHRDVTPGNVLLARDYYNLSPKLTDFGIAKVKYGRVRTVMGAPMGTPHFMSPEQLRDSRKVTSLTDIYSFGVLLYYCLTSRHPFEHEDLNRLMVIVMAGGHGRAIELRPDLPPALDALIESCMAVNPQDRPQNCREVLELMLGIDWGEEGERPPGPPRRLRGVDVSYDRAPVAPPRVESGGHEMAPPTVGDPSGQWTFSGTPLDTSNEIDEIEFQRVLRRTSSRWLPKVIGLLVLVAAIAVGTKFALDQGIFGSGDGPAGTNSGLVPEPNTSGGASADESTGTPAGAPVAELAPEEAGRAAQVRPVESTGTSDATGVATPGPDGAVGDSGSRAAEAANSETAAASPSPASAEATGTPPDAAQAEPNEAGEPAPTLAALQREEDAEQESLTEAADEIGDNEASEPAVNAAEAADDRADGDVTAPDDEVADGHADEAARAGAETREVAEDEDVSEAPSTAAATGDEDSEGSERRSARPERETDEERVSSRDDELMLGTELTGRAAERAAELEWERRQREREATPVSPLETTDVLVPPADAAPSEAVTAVVPAEAEEEEPDEQLTPMQVNAALRARRGDFRDCFEGTEADPITMRIRIRPHGQVAFAAPTTEGADPNIVRCLVQVLSTTEFPAFDGRTMNIRHSFSRIGP